MALFKVQAPDGTIIKVEAADQATAIRGAQEHYASRAPAQASAPKTVPAASKSPPRQRNAFGEVAGAMANFNRGLGIGDEMAAGFKTAGNVITGKTPVTDIVPDFKRAMASQRQLEDSYAADRPNVSALARGTGMAATALVPTGQTANAFAQGSRLANMARGATAAGITGAAYAATDRGTLRERANSAAKASVDPVTLALGAGAGALSPTRATKPKAPAKVPAPTLDELTASKNAAYKAVEQSGEQFAPQAVNGFVDDLTAEMKAANINPARHPKAASMLEDIQALRDQPMSLTQLDQLRQVIRRDVGNAPDAAEKFMGGKMIDALDGFIDTSPAASSTVKEARGLNTKVRKIEAVTEAVDSAKLRAGSTGSGGNIDNATRQNLRRVFEKTRNFTPEEQAALERIIVGSKGQNALRQVGKLSPQGNGLMTALSIGGTMANPALGIPTAAGAVSKVLADRMTQNRVKELVDLIARGSETPEAQSAIQELSQIAAKDPAVAALRGQVAARASRAAGVAGAASQRNAFAPASNP
jgi:hypothetical protein